MCCSLQLVKVGVIACFERTSVFKAFSIVIRFQNYWFKGLSMKGLTLFTPMSCFTKLNYYLKYFSNGLTLGLCEFFDSHLGTMFLWPQDVPKAIIKHNLKQFSSLT